MQAALYARVSTDEQREGRTIESQIKELERFAEANSHVIVRRYVDEGWSGSLLSRPALDELRDDAAQGRFQAVLVADVDRLSRDVSNLAVLRRDLERCGVALIFQKLPNDNSPLANFMINILGSFAEFERALITDRTRRGKRFKVQERRVIMGNLPPYGFRYVRKDRERGIDGHYEVEPHEAQVVQMMYGWVIEESLSQRAVVRRLNALGIPARHGGRWARSSVHRILTNETYAGVTFYGKHQPVDPPTAHQAQPGHPKTSRRVRPKTDWIPIPLTPDLHLVPRELFERVQRQHATHRTFAARNTKYFYLLREVRKTCGRCGASYSPTPYHARCFYRCNGRDLTEGRQCRAKIISAKRLDSAIWAAVTDVLSNPGLIAKQIEAWLEHRQERDTTASADLGRLEEQLKGLLQEEERVLVAYRRGATTLQQFEREIAAVNAQREALATPLERARRAAEDALSLVPTKRAIAAWAAIARKNIRTMEDGAKQRFLGCLLNAIVIDGDRVTVHAEIPAARDDSQIVPTSSGRRGHKAGTDSQAPRASRRERADTARLVKFAFTLNLDRSTSARFAQAA